MIQDPITVEIHPLHQEDIVFYIFSFLLKKELIEVGKVCSQWNMISCSSPQWKRIHLYTKETSKEIFQVIRDEVPRTNIGRYSGANLIELTYEFDGSKLNNDIFFSIIQSCKNIQTLRLLGNSIFEFSLCGPFVETGKLMTTEQLQKGRVIHEFSENIFNIYLANVKNLDIRGLNIGKFLEIAVWIESLMPQLESLKLGWVFESADLDFLRPSWQSYLLQFHVSAMNHSKSNNKDLAPAQLHSFSLVGFSRGVNCGSLQNFLAPCTQLTNLNLCCDYYLFDEEEESFQFFEQITFINNTIADLNLRATELNDHALIRIAENCPNLKRINVGCTPVTKRGVDSLLDNCILTDLDLCYCQNLTSIGITFLDQVIEKVFILTFLDNENTLALMTKIAKKCSTNLKMLGLGGFQNLTDDSFHIILSHCGNIAHLGIGGCSNLTSHSFEYMVKYIGNSLENLNAHNLVQIAEPAWIFLFNGCIKLKIVQAEDNPQLNQKILSKYRIDEKEDW